MEYLLMFFLSLTLMVMLWFMSSMMRLAKTNGLIRSQMVSKAPAPTIVGVKHPKLGQVAAQFLIQQQTLQQQNKLSDLLLQ
mmetsp:Transcript_2964/g.5356  ORF Transcript_2964/g.5356 Transcript_2964/m.5356 type:complete len:81 (-) Transcript_2964:142-384(-)